ncbi:MAG: beta-galactosidase [Armatimonadota bacterium]|nr:beta-galactosidase [Armatimonadota bacterium]MCX7778182.1 beta-galactosidase [Armatimonadota bacterium]MDW8026225.1 beta-galactosidase [Armatimonadota bacterium]
MRCTNMLLCIYLSLSLFHSAMCLQQNVRWRFVGGSWRVVDGQIVGESTGGHAFAIPTFSRYGRAQTVEAVMLPKERIAGGWVAAGICIYQDGGNFWRLALVEAPDGKTRYAELVAMNDGVWQAQTELKLKVIAEHGSTFSWSWGQRYQLRILLTRSEIEGQVIDLNGNLMWRRCYALNDTPIVRSGWMALNVQGMNASFDGARQSVQGEIGVVLSMRSAVVVMDEVMGNLHLSRALANELNGIGLKVRLATLKELSDDKWWRSIDSGITVLPNGRRMPAACRDGLLEFLRCGGKIITFGVPLFEEVLFRVRTQTGERWMTAGEIDALRRATKPERFLIERVDEAELKRWTHAASHSGVSDKLGVERYAFKANGTTLDALRIDLELKGWGIFSRAFDSSPFESGHVLTCLWAKGAPQTKSLMIEWREVDGSRWFAHVPLSAEWKLIVLSPHDFIFRRDSPTAGKRGFAGDCFKVENARTLVLGMEGPMPHGMHTIFVAGIGTAKDPVEGAQVKFAAPSLEALCPAYKFYPLRKVSSINFIGMPPHKPEKLILSAPLQRAVAPVPRHTGIGFVGGRPSRYVPLANPPIAWLMLNADLPYARSWWLCFGSADEDLWLTKSSLNLIRRMIERLIDGIVLIEGGADRFTAYEDEAIKLGATVANLSDNAADIKVRVEVKAIAGAKATTKAAISFEEKIRLTSGDIETVTWKLPKLRSGRYEVDVRLLSAYGGAEVTYDELRSELVVTMRPKVTDEDKVTIRGGHFVHRGKRWFAFGLNYWPRFIAGQEPTDYGRHWLDPINYDPTVVEEDLRILKSIGMNCVSISFYNANQALPLRDFLRRCYEHGIKVNLFISGAHPLEFNPNIIRQLIESADLPNQPALFAYDIAWEPRLGGYGNRRAHDAEWRKWLIENYGDIEAAERDFGFKLPRDDKGNVTVPMDEHLLKDGEWRIMAAAYRRFLDDFISRSYRRVCRFIRNLDPNHLIGARTGYGGGPFGAEGAFPFDHTAGAKHLDFISPEGWNLGWLGQADEEQFASAAFITAYARWAGNGKPVFWAEFGLTLRHGSFSLDWYDDEERLKAQAKLYEAFYRLIRITDADGAMGWWFPGGYRVDERSDFGLVNPDGTIRPAAEVARKWATAFMNMPMVDRRQVAYITIDRDENARGPMALWLKHGDEASRLSRDGKLVMLRTDGTGKTCDEVPRLAIGNTKWEPMKPPKFINGEFNAVFISPDGKRWHEVNDGDTVRLKELGFGNAESLWLKVELGNTGEAAWLPPSQCKDELNGIVLSIGVDGNEAMRVPITKRVERFEDVAVNGIKLPLPKKALAVQITLRLQWRNSPFGEAVNFFLER